MSDNNPLSTELVLETGNGDKANIKNLPAPIMQALYYQITRKRERISKYFDSDYVIDKDTIKNLVVKLEQTLEQFNIQGSNLSATIIHFAKDKQDCSSLEKFNQYDSSRTDPVSSISLKFDFLLTPPNLPEPQNYTIDINFNSFVLLKSDKFARRGIGRHGQLHAIDLDIQYVDYVVARSFLGTIEEWIESLQKNNIVRLPIKISDRRYEILQSIKDISAISISCFLYFIIFKNEYSIYNITIGISIFFIFRTIFEIALDVIEEMAFPFSYFPFIIMNNGDKRNFDKFIIKRNKYAIIGISILSTIILGIIVNIISVPAVKIFS